MSSLWSPNDLEAVSRRFLRAVLAADADISEVLSRAGLKLCVLTTGTEYPLLWLGGVLEDFQAGKRWAWQACVFGMFWSGHREYSSTRERSLVGIMN
jgi:hypothetical protein